MFIRKFIRKFETLAALFCVSSYIATLHFVTKLLTVVIAVFATCLMCIQITGSCSIHLSFGTQVWLPAATLHCGIHKICNQNNMYFYMATTVILPITLFKQEFL